MAVVLLVNPKGKSGTPKVWGYDTADKGRVFFGSINSTWQWRSISGNAVTVSREKQGEGYLSVGQFADFKVAEGFRSAWNDARSNGRYSYNGNDATQGQFASALRSMGYQATATTTTTPPAPAPAAAPPAAKPASARAKATFFKSLDAEMKRVNKGALPDVLDF